MSGSIWVLTSEGVRDDCDGYSLCGLFKTADAARRYLEEAEIGPELAAEIQWTGEGEFFEGHSPGHGRCYILTTEDIYDDGSEGATA